MNKCGSILIRFLLLAFAVQGNEMKTICRHMSYENRNQTDYGPFLVSAIKGNAIDFQGVAVPRVCLGVFSESGEKLVTSTQTDRAGHFGFGRLPTGSYRLVAKHEGFAPANVKLRVEPNFPRNKSLKVQLRFAGPDGSSYFELK